MTPAPFTSASSDAPLPPLSSLPTSPGQGGPAPDSPLAGLMSAILPIKAATEQIRSACQQIVQSGAVPGAESVCAQIIALSSSLMPMAAQNAMQGMGPMGGMDAGMGMGGGGGLALPPPPGGPPPIGPGV